MKTLADAIEKALTSRCDECSSVTILDVTNAALDWMVEMVKEEQRECSDGLFSPTILLKRIKEERG